MHVVLISTYDLGRQPFGLASPAAWLREAGFDVTCTDLAIDPLDEGAIRSAGLVAFHLPMHTATRLTGRHVPRVRELNPRARLCFYGLYAPLNAAYLEGLVPNAIIVGAEFEAALVEAARSVRDAEALEGPAADGAGDSADLPKLRFRVPERDGLPALERYAHVHLGDGSKRTTGYTETTRGCIHLCRHCPVVPVYEGSLRVVQREVVLEDIRRQVQAGAEHITFGDPDFFNATGHAMAIVEGLHREHPDLSYDVTIKVEHLLRHRQFLTELARTGCLFVTSAVESLDDRVLERLDKGHTRQGFVDAVRSCRDAGLVLNPTFVAFHPWLSLDDYVELLTALIDLDVVDQVASIQLALRLLIPRGSRLLELPEVRALVGPFDESALFYPWNHADPRVDELQREVTRIVEGQIAAGAGRRAVFATVLQRAAEAAGTRSAPELDASWWRHRVNVPYLTEPWYC